MRSNTFKSRVTFSNIWGIFLRRRLISKWILILLHFLPFLENVRMTGKPLQDVSVQRHILDRTWSSQVCNKSWWWMKMSRKQKVNYLSSQSCSPAVAFSNPTISLNKTASIPWGNKDKNNWQYAPASLQKRNSYLHQGERLWAGTLCPQSANEQLSSLILGSSNSLREFRIHF